MDDSDPFGDDGATTTCDYAAEQRTTERMLDDIRSNGFRDGHQKYMENEAYLQIGFDQAYKIFAKLAILTGQVRSLSSKLISNNSSLLARLNDKLDKIDSYPYETKITWNHQLQPNFDSVVQLVSDFVLRLSQLKDILFSSSSSFTLGQATAMENNLNQLQIEQSHTQDDDLDNQLMVDSLNNLIDNFAI